MVLRDSSVRRTDERSPHLATILDLCHTTSYERGSHHIRQLLNITFMGGHATQMRSLAAGPGEKQRGRRSGMSDGRVIQSLGDWPGRASGLWV